MCHPQVKEVGSQLRGGRPALDALDVLLVLSGTSWGKVMPSESGRPDLRAILALRWNPECSMRDLNASQGCTSINILVVSQLDEKREEIGQGGERTRA
jgi:hypothetical protein